MKPTYTNYSTINEDFDFGSLEIESVDMDTLEDGVSEAMATRNLEIPLDQILAGAFKLKLSNVMSQKLTFGKYMGWCHPKNKKPVKDKINDTCRNTIENILNNGIPSDTWGRNTAKESTCLINTIPSHIIHNFNAATIKDITSAGFKFICNSMPSGGYNQAITDVCLMDASEIDERVCQCINETIKYVTGHDYDFRDTLFAKETVKKPVNKQIPKLFYKIWVSPDNGLIIIDHISEYDAKDVKRNQWHSGEYDIYNFPKSIMIGAVIFTNIKGYVLHYDKKESKQQLYQVEIQKKELKFINALEASMTITCKRLESYAYLDKLRGIDHYEVHHDPHGHIWYPAVPLNAYMARDYRSPAPKTYKIPNDLTNLKKAYGIFKFSTVMGNSNEWIQCVSHPKIRGYRHIKMPGIIIYQTNDPVFCEKLLGPGSASYLRNYADMYYLDKKTNDYICLWSFIWFDDWAMEICDKFIDDPKSSISSLTKFLREVKQVSHGNFIRAQVNGKL